jgi:MoaA/NifB/PqqE/SkfB family radical SAM enzyme
MGISLDGIGEIHDQIRGIPGGYDKVMKTITMLKDLGITNLRLAFTAGDYNINELHKVYNLSKELGVQFTLAAIHNAENYFNTVDNKITKISDFEREFKALIKEELNVFSLKHWLRAYFTYALLQFIKTGKRLLPNYSGKDNIFIDPLGEVYPSDVSGHTMGNIKQFENFEKLFNSVKAQEAIELEALNQNWMICTARSAIKKHPLKVLSWIIKSKLFGI